jgi:1-acyl-sn-glycerol-3-phosphate acyltransferase
VRELLEILSRPQAEDPLARRSPEAIDHLRALFDRLIDAWYAPEIAGFQHFPDGPALVVGMHNGGNMSPDMFALMGAFWREYGSDYPSYGLAHDALFRIPGAGRLLSVMGGVPAAPGTAETLLGRGATVLVYPGGDVDAFKPYPERYQVKFGGRSGFVRLALRTGVPIVPVVSVGAHEGFRVLTDGRAIARAFGLKRLFRTEVWPIILSFPGLLTFGPFSSYLPVPTKLHVKLLPAIRFDHGPDAADDRELVARLAEEVRQQMQRTVDQMRDLPHGPRARLRELL